LARIAKDPAYAPAHAGLAYAYVSLAGSLGVLSPREGFEKAKAEISKALSLDDGLAETHSSLGWIKLHYDWDTVGAEAEFRRAIELNPSDAQAHHLYAHYLMAMGRTEEAWAESLRTLQLDPSGVRANAHQGWHYFYVRDYDHAIRDLQRTLVMQPNDFYSRRYLANAYEQKGMYAEALADLQQTPPAPALTPVMQAAFGYADAVAGKRPEATRIAGELENRAKKEYVSAFDIGLIYLGMAEKERALDWLERAFHERSWYLIYMRVDPRFDSLRSDPRFQDLIRRVSTRQNQ
jgi:tetratricopeptide (TPR) repeat protein